MSHNITFDKLSLRLYNGPMTRKVSVGVRLDQEDADFLDGDAKAMGTTVSELFRRMIKLYRDTTRDVIEK